MDSGIVIVYTICESELELRMNRDTQLIYIVTTFFLATKSMQLG